MVPRTSGLQTLQALELLAERMAIYRHFAQTTDIPDRPTNLPHV
jgi:hypothetical protein